MRRCTALLLTAAVGWSIMGCTDSNRESSPTAPSFAVTLGTCDLSTARSLVNSIYPMSLRTTANNLLQSIQNAGPKTETATNAGFDLFGLLASDGTGLAGDRSTFVNAVIPCQDVG